MGRRSSNGKRTSNDNSESVDRNRFKLVMFAVGHEASKPVNMRSGFDAYPSSFSLQIFSTSPWST